MIIVPAIRVYSYELCMLNPIPLTDKYPMAVKNVKESTPELYTSGPLNRAHNYHKKSHLQSIHLEMIQKMPGPGIFPGILVHTIGKFKFVALPNLHIIYGIVLKS